MNEQSPRATKKSHNTSYINIFLTANKRSSNMLSSQHPHTKNSTQSTSEDTISILGKRAQPSFHCKDVLPGSIYGQILFTGAGKRWPRDI